MPEESVQFVASLEGTSCLRFDGDGAGTIRFSVPASEIAAVAQLLAYREQPLRVTVAPEKEEPTP